MAHRLLQSPTTSFSGHSLLGIDPESRETVTRNVYASTRALESSFQVSVVWAGAQTTNTIKTSRRTYRYLMKI
jgi:hypothetical protein